jgi:hypothetical protein
MCKLCQMQETDRRHVLVSILKVVYISGIKVKLFFFSLLIKELSALKAFYETSESFNKNL